MCISSWLLSSSRLRNVYEKIDIDYLDEAELVDLNHRIVERLRLLQQMPRICI